MNNPCLRATSGIIVCLALIGIAMVVPATPTLAGPRLVVSNISKDGAFLCADLRLYDVLDSELINSIKDGVPAMLRYRIDLWKKRGLWYDKLVASFTTTYRIEYDNWRMHYLVLRADREDNLVGNGNIAEIIHLACNQPHLKICPLESLDSLAEYYLNATAEIRLLTAEKIREIDQWLAGKDRGGGMLGLIVGLLGSKPRSAETRSSSFRIDEIN